MNLARFTLLVMGIAAFSGCSCGIYSEVYENRSFPRRISEEDIREEIAAHGFRRQSEADGRVRFRKRVSSIELLEVEQKLVFHSSICGFPWELVLDRNAFEEIEAIERQLVDSLEGEGIHLYRLSPEEESGLHR